MFLGIEGERRKIIVSDFKWKENEAEISFEDIRDAKIEGNIKHYSILTDNQYVTYYMCRGGNVGIRLFKSLKKTGNDHFRGFLIR